MEDTQMNCITRLIRWTNERAHRFTAFDLKLVQFEGIFVALIVVKLIPGIMRISIWWFVALFALFSIRPIYLFLHRDDPAARRGKGDE
jgi:hypothetical protein